MMYTLCFGIAVITYHRSRLFFDNLFFYFTLELIFIKFPVWDAICVETFLVGKISYNSCNLLFEVVSFLCQFSEKLQALPAFEVLKVALSSDVRGNDDEDSRSQDLWQQHICPSFRNLCFYMLDLVSCLDVFLLIVTIFWFYYCLVLVLDFGYSGIFFFCNCCQLV